MGTEMQVGVAQVVWSSARQCSDWHHVCDRSVRHRLELGASTSLARLWQQQGKKEEARQMLAEIYGWFTEGFDTKDLKEAKTLLEELN